MRNDSNSLLDMDDYLVAGGAAICKQAGCLRPNLVPPSLYLPLVAAILSTLALRPRPFLTGDGLKDTFGSHAFLVSPVVYLPGRWIDCKVVYLAIYQGSRIDVVRGKAFHHHYLVLSLYTLHIAHLGFLED